MGTNGQKPNWLGYISISRDLGENGGAHGITPEGLGVYIPKAIRNFVMTVLLDLEPQLELPLGTYVQAQLQDSDRRGVFEDQPFFSGRIHRLATQEEFLGATPAPDDDLDRAGDTLATAIETFIAMPIETEIFERVRKRVPEIKMTDPRLTNLAAEEVAKAEEERTQQARDVVAELLNKGDLPGMLLNEAKRRIEVGHDAYWNIDPNTPKVSKKKGKSVTPQKAPPAETSAAAG